MPRLVPPLVLGLVLVASALVGVPGGAAYAVDTASVSGVVTGPGGVPAADVCVTVYDPDEDELGDTVTASDGTYRVTALPAAVVRVEFEDCGDATLVGEWYDDAAGFDDATPLTLGVGRDTTIDVRLAAGGSVSGTVAVPAGASAADVCVEAYDLAESSLGATSPAPDGTYTIAGLPPGDVKVDFDQCGGTLDLLEQWYADQPTFASATRVRVTTGGVTPRVDATLAADPTGGGDPDPTTPPGPGAPTPAPVPAPAPAPVPVPSAACVAATSTLAVATAAVTRAQARLASATRTYRRAKRISAARRAAAKRRLSVARSNLRTARAAVLTATAAEIADC